MKVSFRRAFSLATGCLLLLASFQNCSRTNHGSTPKGGPGKLNLSGGQAYDGKLFVMDGNCEDGSKVESRIILESPSSAYLVRDNCQTADPKPLTSSDFTYSTSDSSHLTFGKRVFHAETPSISIAPLSKAYYQWNGSFLTSSYPLTYFVDGAELTNAEISQLRALGHTVICLMVAGVTSTTAADYNQFQKADLGRSNGSEIWLDTRSANVRRVLKDRLLLAESKGCQGVLWDQTDAYLNSSGFPLTADTQFDFLKYLSLLTRDRGLLVVMANTPGLASRAVDYFDLAYSQNCNQKGYCSAFNPFVEKGKAVMISDDGAFSTSLCKNNTSLGFTLWFTTPTQDGSRFEPCP